MQDRPLFHRVKHRLLETWPAESWRDTTVVIGLSGGPDSVALLRLLADIQQEEQGSGRIVVAHFDHCWRHDSAHDARYCASLAAGLGLEFRLGHDAASLGQSAERRSADIAADRREEQARAVRYQFLLQTALVAGARWVVVGHTLDDQVETIVHQIVRGSGLRGASGMPTTRCLHEAVTLIRPLLEVSRCELRQLLASWGQSFCQDPANESLDYARVRIRHHVLPALRTVHADADRAILRFGLIAQEASAFLSSLVPPVLARNLVSDESNGVVLDALGLRGEPALIVRETLIHVWRSRSWPLQDMAYDKWCALEQLIRRRQGGHENLPGQVTATCDGRILCIQRREPME